MKLLFQILLFFLTCFSSSATPVFAKTALPNYKISFPKTENQKLENEIKIGVENFARSGISDKSRTQSAKGRKRSDKSGWQFLNSSSQKGVLQERNVSENRVWQKRQWSWWDGDERVF